MAAFRRTQWAAQVLWEMTLGTRLNSNIASARFADGTLAIAAGLDSGLLRVWLP